MFEGPKKVTLACVDLTDTDMTFPEVAKHLAPAEFLKTQREKFEAARMRALTMAEGGRGNKMLRVPSKILRAKARRKLVLKKRRGQLKDFLSELRSRQAEGYSARQLIKSHIPDIGSEVQVNDAEVTAALKHHKAGCAPNFAATRIIIYCIIDLHLLLAS